MTTAIAAAVVATGVALGMLGAGRPLDPWTMLVTAALAVSVASAPWAQLRRRATPALFEDVDERTGVGTARAVLTLLDRELDRTRSYGSTFSLAVLELDRAMFAGVTPRRTTRLLSGLVTGLAGDVRLGDRVCHASASDRELVVVVLPDTGAQGARTFVSRLVEHTQRHLAAEGVAFEGHMRAEPLSHPDDLPEMQRLQRRLEVLEGTEALIRDVAVRRRRHRRTGESTPLAIPTEGELTGARHE